MADLDSLAPRTTTRGSPAGGPPRRATGKRRPIRFWLRWLVITCVIPAWAVAAFLIADSYERARATINAGTVATARALMQAVDGELLSLQSAAQVLSTSAALAAGNFADFYAQAQEVQRLQGAINVVLVQPLGRQLINTLRPFGAPLPVAGAPGKLPLVFSKGVPVISDLFTGPVTERPIMAVVVPVVLGGQVVYGLGVNLTPERFAEILLHQNPPPHWIISIFDSTGTIVARTRDPEQFVGKKGAPQLLQRMSEIAEGVTETSTLEGIPVLFGFSRSSFSGWTVAIGIPRADLTADLTRSLWLSIAAVGALLIAAVLAARALSNRIARSIRALNQPALALASGQMLAVPAIEISEVAEVGAALLQASGRLAQREADRTKAAAAERQAAVAERVAAEFRGLLEAAPDAMIVVRHDGGISFANGHAETIFGYARSELLGRSVEQLIPERFRGGHDAHVKGFFTSPTLRPMGVGLALFARRKDGSEFPVEVSLSPIEHDGEACVIATVRDVTERKRLEASVEASRAQMADSARLSALGVMAGGIAHEINNPLAVIHALASDLAEAAEHREAAPEEVARTTRQIARYADRIAMIVTSMRYIAREGADDPLTEVAVSEIVERVLALCAERFRSLSVDLQTTPIDPAIRVACREVQIAQVLTNLLQNAFDAAQEQSRDKWVRLEVAATDDTVVLSVIDCGTGVPPALKSRIMEPFFTTKPVGKGTGLGLSLSKRIAEEHGGSLAVDEAGGHTRFSLRLPLSGHGGPACS